MDKKKFFLSAGINYNIKSRWFVYYYQLDYNTAKKIRIKNYGDLQKFKTVEARLQAAEQLIDELTCLDIPLIRYKYQDLISAMHEALDYRKIYQVGKVRQLNKNYLDTFEFYLKRKQRNDIPGFITYLSEEKLLSNTTINRYVAALRTLFTEMKRSGKINVNPCDHIRKLKERRNHGKAYKPSEKVVLLKTITDSFPELYWAVRWVYYCFIRPNELRDIKIKQVDFERGTITVYSSSAKDAEQRILNIPEIYLQLLRDFGIDKYHAGCYLISRNGLPGETQCGINYLYKQHKKLLHECNITGHYLYEWKHTGNRDAHDAGVPMNELRLHNGHSTLKTTAIYLARITPEDLTKVKTIFPEI